MILVATPTRGEVAAMFASDLVQLIKHSPEADWAVGLGTLICNNRTLLVHAAVKVKATHILFIDSDMRFPPDVLDRLLAHKKDIVGVNYRQRTRDEWTARKSNKFITSVGKKGIEEVENLGFGMVLIRTGIFTNPLRSMPPNAFSMPFDTSTGIYVGEDVYFCTIAREKGFKLYVDHDLSQEIKHIGQVELGV